MTPKDNRIIGGRLVPQTEYGVMWNNFLDKLCQCKYYVNHRGSNTLGLLPYGLEILMKIPSTKEFVVTIENVVV